VFHHFITEPSRGTPKYAEEIEAEKKRCLRADQHNTRSGRSVYQLQQQVSGLQADIDAQAKSKVRLKPISSFIKFKSKGRLKTMYFFIEFKPKVQLKTMSSFTLGGWLSG
jgi:hypothetical protein